MTRAVVAWTWYAEHLGPGVRVPLGVDRADQLIHHAGPEDLILTMARAPGVRRLLMREGVRGRKRVVLLEFIRTRPHGWRRAYEWLLGVGLRRSVHRLHVLSSSERREYAARYRLAPDAVVLEPWPLCGPDIRRPAPPRAGTRRVFASGRAACDWPTLFAAAERAGRVWELTVVCSTSDAPAVRNMNHVGARIEVDVPRQRHEELMAGSDVYVLALREEHISSGQVRLMNAIAAGVPVVATQVDGLLDYLSDPGVALTVPAGDASAVAQAVDALLDDPGLRHRRAEQAQRAVQGRTYERYFHDLARDLLSDHRPGQ
jgi:hypothetical protein